MIKNKIIKIQKTKIFKNLNEKQTKTLYYFNSPLRIITNTNNKKTKILTKKITYLINILNISPDHILTITFTNKTTSKISKKIKQYTNTKFNKNTTKISTFHSLYTKILKKKTFHINLKNNFQIINNNNKKKILKNIYKKHDLIPTNSNFKNLTRFFSWLKNKLYTNNKKIINFINSNPENKFYDDNETIIKIYNFYNKQLKHLQNLNFNNLLIKINKLFYKNPKIIKK